MKKIFILAILAVSTIMLASCSTDDPFEDLGYNDSWNNGTTNTDGSSAATGDLTTFDVAIDLTTAEPTDVATAYYPDEEDALENNEFTTEVTIDLSNPVAKTENGVEVTVEGGHVKANHGETKKVCYVVSGTTTNGSFTVLGDKKYAVKLNGVSITNPDSAALNLLSGKRAFVILADGTTNTLADGTGGSQKGALYCKGKLLFNGSGSLSVKAGTNNGIHSADYIVFGKGNNIYVKSTANHGIKANDGIYVNGGILNVEVSAAAAKGLNCESNIQFNGGRTTVITTGHGTYEDGEAKASAAVKADSIITVNGGELWLKSTGSGGKGLKADWEIYLNGGSVSVITEGSKYTSGNDTASPKGIKAGTKNVHGVLDINGGTIMVRTSGQNGEGIESKGTLTVSDGTVQVAAYDDAVNSSGNMYVKGGTMTVVGQNSDGLDANGNMYISGGTVVAFGAGGAETGIDVGEQYKLNITGGNIFGIGGRIDATLGSTSQGIISATGSVSANTSVTVSNGSSTLATFVMPPYNYNNGSIMLSTTGMTSGNSYTVTFGSSSQTLTASSSLSSSGMGGNMGFGGKPGGK